MKTYYDLTKEEKQKYVKEFKKTPVGKDMNIKRTIVNLVTTIIVILFLVIDVYYETNLYTSILFFVFLIDFINETYFNINFTSWLKNKHDIKRW